jgi:hypothetical protein
VLPDPLAIATGGPHALDLQSMLVTINNVTATSASANADFNVVPTGAAPGSPTLRVTSFVASDLTMPPMISGTVGQTFTSITGYVYANGGNSKLAPRNATDVVTP